MSKSKYSYMVQWTLQQLEENKILYSTRYNQGDSYYTIEIPIIDGNRLVLWLCDYIEHAEIRDENGIMLSHIYGNKRTNITITGGGVVITTQIDEGSYTSHHFLHARVQTKEEAHE